MKTQKFNLFDVFNVLFMVFLFVIMVYPLLNVFAISLSDYAAFARNPLMFVPKNINLDAYRTLINSSLIKSSYANTVFVTVVGTAINVVVTVLCAYPLSKDYLRGSKQIMLILIFSMLFQGGMIPTYYVVRGLGLINSLWALILPTAMNGYYMIIMRSFFQNQPASLEESAKIEGANDLHILFRIIIPISLPAISTIILFYAVINWNIFMAAVIYMNDRKKWTLQVLLREMITQNSDVFERGGDIRETTSMVFPRTLRSATVIATMLPILCVYPYLQKYFMKGILLGAVKG